MSELTKIEELKDRRVKSWDDYRQMKVIAGEAIQFAEQMARELLSLRTRDVGDDEVRESTTNSLNQRLSQAFDAGNAVEFSIAAADAVVYAETLEQTNERLHNRNKAQGARIKELEPELNSLSNQLREAQAEIERLKWDAERYRWLRSHSWHEPYHIFFGPGCNQLEPHHLDQAIDKEMKYPIQGEDKPQYEEGDGGYYDLLPGGLDQ